MKRQSTFKTKKNSILVNNLANNLNTPSADNNNASNANMATAGSVNNEKFEIMRQNLIQIHEKLSSKKNTFTTSRDSFENLDSETAESDPGLRAISIHSFVHKIFSNSDLCEALEVKPLPSEKFDVTPESNLSINCSLKIRIQKWISQSIRKVLGCSNNNSQVQEN